MFRMVFETDVNNIPQITWDFALKENALGTIERIVFLIDPARTDPMTSLIYKDLAKGFD